jgi:predicted N-acetyltransferase YhbS/catechol 2,3-dioxygenase-like lactoylglutathione lyase family enzyme
MKPRISVLTLGVDDLDRSVRFYRDGLGLHTAGIVGREFEFGAVAFFSLQSGLRLALWPRKSIAHDSGLDISSPSPTELTIGHNVSSRSEVDDVMRQAAAAGATIVKRAHDTLWGGYAGYFLDPDQHLWEVVWNPHLLPEIDTTIVIRSETATDEDAIREVTHQAFRGHPYSAGNEQDIIDALRAQSALAVSMVAAHDDAIVGHVAFSPASSDDGTGGWYTLGPVSVLPGLQRRGIGRALINAGIDRLRELGASGCILIGDTNYYSRFGFIKAPHLAPPGAPKEHFMILGLRSASSNGVLSFHPAFDE